MGRKETVHQKKAFVRKRETLRERKEERRELVKTLNIREETGCLDGETDKLYIKCNKKKEIELME